MTILQCPVCNATAEAPCDCGVAYMPKTAIALREIARDPSQSDRIISEKTGVGLTTVWEARQGLGKRDPAERRKGKDGKTYTMPNSAKTTPQAAARITTTRKDRGRKVKVPPSGVPIPKQANILTWQLTKFREDWVSTALAFHRDYPDCCAALSRCAASNALALTQLAEALQGKDGCVDVDAMEVAA